MIEPKLRFKADDGSQFPDWEEKTVGDITVELQDYEPLSSGYPLMTSSRTGLMMQNEFRSKSSTDDSMAIFSVVPRGVATYRHMSDDDIFHFNINNLVDKGLVSKEYPVFNTKDNYNLYLLVEYLNSSRNFLNFCKAQKKGGTRTRLYFKVLKDFKLNMPSFPEQQKIAEFLSTVDTVIEKQKETVSAWEERKKGVMQKLFNQEVRFKADDGSNFPEWEEKKLGEVFTERTERSKGGESLLSVTIAQGIVKQSETDKRNIASENKSNYKIVKKNDLAYNTMRMWQGAEGVSEYDGIVSPAYTVITAVDGNNSYFFETMFKQTFMLQVFQRFSQGLTSDTWNLKFPAFSEIKCLIPCEDEQNKIVECVAVLDEVIEKQKATLAAWEELKKGLLQQMFC